MRGGRLRRTLHTMLLRFVVSVVDPGSGRRRGVLHAAARLRESDQVSATDRQHLRDLADWFEEHLERPTTFAISSRPHAKAQALSWFKHTAVRHIARMREFAQILGTYGVVVEVIRTRRPGYVVFEDEYQVTAYPFADTST